MNVFKSKYYHRIIERIAELEEQKEKIEAERDKIKQTLKPVEYCIYSARIDDYEKKINLLRGLL